MLNKRQRITHQTYNDSAKNYEKDTMDVTLYKDGLNKFCERIPNKPSKILEIGCGPGNVSKYVLSKRPNAALFGIDLAPKMIELAKINNPNAVYQVMDCREISSLETQYDAILNSFCLPYLTAEECAKIIKDSFNLLSYKGVMYLSTMEGEASDSGYEPASFDKSKKVYINYHPKDFLLKCFEESNFEVTDFQCIKSPNPNGSFFKDMLFILKKES